MSFTVTIKEEIVKTESTESEIIAELSGYIRNNSIISKDTITMTTENNFIVERITNSIKDIFDITPKVKEIGNLNFSKNTLYEITIKDELNKVLKTLGIKEDNKYLDTVPEYIVGANEEIRGYLRGVFLGSGSINDPKKSRYHLEFHVNNEEYAKFIVKSLNEFYLNSKYIKRENKYMIYIKEAEKIGDFLRIINAPEAVLYYEDIRIYRDHKNMTNRLNNMEQANVDKMIETANRQIEEIEKIKSIGGLDLLDDKVKEVAIYRLKYPEASLVELSEIISLETGKEITKSGLYHRFKKISDLAKKVK